ncbi:MAG TPA: hypothetical protein VMM35_12350 [Longimicrobiales bacterium]|nr:hypothetical protein [Longimicrobiales bacterium]
MGCPLGLAAGLNLYRLAPNVWRWADPLGLTCSIHLDYAMELARRLFDESAWMREIQRISRIGDLGQRYAAISDFMANYGRATGIRIEIVPSHQASQFGIGPSNWGTYRPAESRILMHEDIFTAPRVNPVDQIGHEVGAAELDRVFGIPKHSVPAIHRTLPGRNYLTHVADMLY